MTSLFSVICANRVRFYTPDHRSSHAIIYPINLRIKSYRWTKGDHL